MSGQDKHDKGIMCMGFHRTIFACSSCRRLLVYIYIKISYLLVLRSCRIANMRPTRMSRNPSTLNTKEGYFTEGHLSTQVVHGRRLKGLERSGSGIGD